MKLPRHYRLKLVAVAAALAFSPLPSLAAGLGKITVLSALGQPLKAELEITGTREELNSISAKVASADAFRSAGIDYAAVLTSLRFSRELRERNGRAYLLLTSDRPLNEPFIDMLVELNWASGRLVREYTFLLDPPESMRTDVPVQAPETAGTAGEARATPVLAPTAPAVSTVAEIAKPAAVPKRTAVQSQQAAAVSADGTNRTVRSGDTLGRIAAEVRPEGVSLDQMLVALFRSNSDAFDGNMNRLRAGKILAIPDAAAAKAIDVVEARREVVAQAADFGAYSRKLAGTVAASKPDLGGASRTSRGSIAPRVEDSPAASPSGKDKLAVSATEMAVTKPGAKAATKDSGPKGRAGAIEEDLVARERALQEANTRIAHLEKNLSDLKKLAELKSESAAKLQGQAEAAKVPPATTAAPAKALEPVATSKPAEAPPAAAKPAEPPAGAKPEVAKAEAVSPAPATPAGSPDAAKPEAPKPVPAPKKKPLPPPEPEPEPDFLEENAPLVFGGAGLVSLLLGYLGIAAYRRKKLAAQAPAISKEDLSANSVFSQTASDSIHSTAAGSDLLSVADAAPEGAAGPVDPLVEADTYLAFGRDTQAEDILIEALKTEPTRHAIHVKLLEIYSARRSPMQFNNLARDLHEQTGGQGANWERVVALGAALDPANPLYGGAEQTLTTEAVPQLPVEQPQAGAVDPDATMVFTAPVASPPAAEASVEFTPAAPEPTASLDFDLDLGSPSASSPEPAAEAVNEIAALDFDLDLGSGSATEAAGKSDPGSSSALALDIDFDLDSPAALPASAEAAGSPVSETESVAALDIDFDSTAVLQVPVAQAAPAISSAPEAALDIALELPSLAAAGDTLAFPAAPAPDTEASVDFDFDLGDASPPVAAPSAALDLGSISLELDTAAPAEPAMAVAESAPLPSLELDASPVAAAETASEDSAEVATKLELAFAYEEMGDLDGARELLDEVVKEGSPAQREAAEARLAALG